MSSLEYSSRVEKRPAFERPQVTSIDGQIAQVFCPTSNKTISFSLDFPTMEKFDKYMESERTFERAIQFGSWMRILTPQHLVGTDLSKENDKREATALDIATMSRTLDISKDEILTALDIARKAIVAAYKAGRK